MPVLVRFGLYLTCILRSKNLKPLEAVNIVVHNSFQKKKNLRALSVGHIIEKKIDRSSFLAKNSSPSFFLKLQKGKIYESY